MAGILGALNTAGTGKEDNFYPYEETLGIFSFLWRYGKTLFSRTYPYIELYRKSRFWIPLNNFPPKYRSPSRPWKYKRKLRARFISGLRDFTLYFHVFCRATFPWNFDSPQLRRACVLARSCASHVRAAKIPFEPPLTNNFRIHTTTLTSYVYLKFIYNCIVFHCFNY